MSPEYNPLDLLALVLWQTREDPDKAEAVVKKIYTRSVLEERPNGLDVEIITDSLTGDVHVTVVPKSV